MKNRKIRKRVQKMYLTRIFTVIFLEFGRGTFKTNILFEKWVHSKKVYVTATQNLVFENDHRDFVLSEHKFVLDNLKNTLIDTNLCEILEFSTQNAKISTQICVD
jgi:hypothetical protein